MKGNVLLAMSGGVDSSVAAILLQEEGYNVTGITFIFGNSKSENDKSIFDAKELAKHLNIKHIVLDLRKEFSQQVITYFKEEYKLGKTPFPCAKCNPQLKFLQLLNSAKIENCEFIATGHYAKMEFYNHNNYICQGKDQDKDQSFFLWGLNSEIRNKLILPLGDKTKVQVRAIAKSRGYLNLSRKKDSLGICFIQGNNYRNFLKSEGIISEAGNFVDTEGNVLGKHQGIINYTIGQRRNLGININSALFVSEIRPDKNEIVLSKFESLFKQSIFINNYYFIDIQNINDNFVYNLRIRYRLQNTPCKISIHANNKAKIYLLEPLAMISNGQTAVFYEGERVIGGGFIEASE